MEPGHGKLELGKRDYDQGRVTQAPIDDSSRITMGLGNILRPNLESIQINTNNFEAGRST